MGKSKNLNKKLVPSHEAMVANLLTWHSLAMASTPERIQYNLHWYETANSEIQAMVDELGVSLHVGCQVVAATSPGMSWEVNIECAKNVIIACQEYLTWADRQAYLRTKAYQVGYTWDNAINGTQAFAGVDIPVTREKTFGFGQCLEFPRVFGLVSPVDMHMIHIACDTRLKGSIQAGVYYGAISKAIGFTATLLGYDEKQFQALLWGTRVDLFKAGVSVDTIYAIIADLVARGKDGA